MTVAPAPYKLGTPAAMAWTSQKRDTDPSGVRLLHWGVDTLYLGVYSRLQPTILAKLLDLHDQARPTRAAWLCSGGVLSAVAASPA